MPLLLRLAALAFALAATACAGTTHPTALATGAAGLVDPDGQPVAVDLASPPRPTVLVFAASWCTSCNHEAPAIGEWTRENAGRFDVITVLVDTEADAAKKFAAQYHVRTPIVWDPALRLGDSYGVDSTPTLLLLDRDGEVEMRANALTDALRSRARELAAPAAAPEAVIERATTMMGTDVSILVRTSTRSVAQRAIEAAFDEMRRVEALMSSWRETSEVSEINRQAGIRPVRVAPELFELLAEARELGHVTSGKFDITYAGAGKLWDFMSDPPRMPDDAQLAAALRRVGIDKLRLDSAASTAYLEEEGMAIGLGGIAKGYAIDRAVAVLESRGLKNFVVNAGGDVYVRGRRAPDELWWVGIRDPRARDRELALLPVANLAVVTSGDYERFFMHDGHRYAHIIDPTTGRPAEGCRSVTVVGDRAARADALATGIFVLGPEAGMALAESLPGVEALIVDADGHTQLSTGLRKPPRTAERR